MLVTAAGTIVSQGIMKSLKLANSIPDSPVKYSIVATDANSEGTGLYRSDLGVVVPAASSPEYVDSILKICKDQMIRAIFIGSDEELAILSKSSKRIQDETGAVVIANPSEVISTGQDKWKTFEFLKRNNLPCAESSLVAEQDRFTQEFGFPLVVKPREGHGSLHMYVVKNGDEIKNAVLEIEKSRLESNVSRVPSSPRPRVHHRSHHRSRGEVRHVIHLHETQTEGRANIQGIRRRLSRYSQIRRGNIHEAWT